MSTITNDKRVDDVHMAFAGGNVKDFTVEPPVSPHPDRIPVSEADRHNVLDPMTVALVVVGGSGDPLSPQACGHKASVFDGRMRFDLRSEYKRVMSSRPKKAIKDRSSFARSILRRFPATSRSDTPLNISPLYAMPKYGLHR